MRNFKKEHSATIIKYLGISFITGGISHGFFTSERQIITVILGIIIFLIGLLLSKDKEEYSNVKILLAATVFAIGIGAFTGGMQHFLDSPERSLIIVPLGAIISIFAFFYIEGENVFQKKYLPYILYFSVLVIILTLISYGLAEIGIFGEHSH